MNDNEQRPLVMPVRLISKQEALERWPTPKAIEDFTRVYNQVITDPDKAGEHLDELAKIMGADGPEPDAGPIPERFKPKP